MILVSKHTPGPWRWELNQKSKSVQLCGGKPRFDVTVMDFVRWGMSGAAPRFLGVEPDSEFKLLTHAKEFAVKAPGREHHASWFRLLDHPDARLMEAAPCLLGALQECMHALGDLMEAAASVERRLAAQVRLEGGAPPEGEPPRLTQGRLALDAGRAVLARVNGQEVGL